MDMPVTNYALDVGGALTQRGGYPELASVAVQKRLALIDQAVDALDQQATLGFERARLTHTEQRGADALTTTVEVSAAGDALVQRSWRLRKILLRDMQGQVPQALREQLGAALRDAELSTVPSDLALADAALTHRFQLTVDGQRVHGDRDAVPASYQDRLGPVFAALDAIADHVLAEGQVVTDPRPSRPAVGISGALKQAGK